jgi:hypothetical protein
MTGVVGTIVEVLVDRNVEGEGEAVVVAPAFGVVTLTAKNIAIPLAARITITISAQISLLLLLCWAGGWILLLRAR